MRSTDRRVAAVRAAKLMREIGGGDVSCRPPRPTRALVSHLLQVIETLEERRAFSLAADPIDTSTPQACSRCRCSAPSPARARSDSERTKAASRRPRRAASFRNPGLREHRSDAIRTIAAARNHVYLAISSPPLRPGCPRSSGCAQHSWATSSACSTTRPALDRRAAAPLGAPARARAPGGAGVDHAARVGRRRIG